MDGRAALVKSFIFLEDDMGENKDYITHPDEKGSINISEEVISVIAASAAMETEGVAALSAGRDLSELLGKKNLSRGVRIAVDGENVKVDVWLTVKLGVSVHSVGKKVQEAVQGGIESMTGFKVTEVNVHVVGVSLK